jgi:16S rRNA processing protein RimM
VSDESDFVLIGLVRRAHGLKGQVCVEPISDIVERFDALEYVLVSCGGDVSEFRVDSVKWKGKSLLVKLDGIDDRTSAEGLRGAEIGVRREDVFPIPEGTYYVFDIVGCEVTSTSGRRVGTVEEVLRMPANDVFVVRRDHGEALVPVVRSVVRNIDLEAKLIVIEEMDGLLD